MKPFQIIAIAVFILLIIVSIFVFALTGGSKSSNVNTTPAVVWGTLPQSYFTALTLKRSQAQLSVPHMTYVQKDTATFDQDVLEALADGNGPDAILISQADIFKNLQRIDVIPYTSYPQRQYTDTFVQEAQLFETHDGLVAIPAVIDPLVMYYNRDILTSNNIALPPKYWDEVVSLIPKLTQSDQSYNIQQSTIALGEYENVAHAKDILSTLFMQTDNLITSYGYSANTKKDILSVVIDQATANGTNSGQSALNFYTQFSDPVKTTYTWNRSLPSSTETFTSGKSAFYIGYASEESTLRAKNPNLNFDVTTIPQPRTSNKKVTFGNLYGFAILKKSINKANAYSAAYAFSASDIQKDFTSIANLPPVRLDLLQTQPPKADMGTFYTAALQSYGWIDPSPQQTETIFKNMIQSVTSGSSAAENEISRAADQLMELLKN